MTVNEMNELLNKIIAEGKGDFPIIGEDVAGFNFEVKGPKVYTDCVVIERENLWE